MNDKLQQKYLDQFDKLINEGMAVTASVSVRRSIHYVSPQLFSAWFSQVVTLFQQTLPPNSDLRQKRNEILLLNTQLVNVQKILGLLQGVRADFESGMLDDLTAQIEESVAVDYLQQAKDLLSEKDNINYSHVPAAVLTGVVLEKTIRTLCEKQNPPIGTVKPDGDFKKAMPLVDELVKIGVFGPAKSNQIKAWLALRNSAAHGRDSEFTQKDVEAMIQGVNDFMAEHLV